MSILMRYSFMEPHPHPEHVTGEATWAPHYFAPILFLSFVPSFMSNRMMSELSHKVDAHTHVWYFPSHNFMHFFIGHPLGTWSMIVLRILLGGRLDSNKKKQVGIKPSKIENPQWWGTLSEKTVIPSTCETITHTQTYIYQNM